MWKYYNKIYFKAFRIGNFTKDNMFINKIFL